MAKKAAPKRTVRGYQVVGSGDGKTPHALLMNHMTNELELYNSGSPSALDVTLFRTRKSAETAIRHKRARCEANFGNGWERIWTAWGLKVQRVVLTLTW